jgi:hypothetical protein
VRCESRLGNTIEATATIEIHDASLRFLAVKPSNQSMISGKAKSQQAVGRVTSLVEAPGKTHVLHDEIGRECAIHHRVETPTVELLKTQVPASGGLAPFVAIRKLTAM